jgi:hypothetical protein
MIAVAMPHTQLKNNTNNGVIIPNSSPAIPLPALKGKTTNNCTVVGNKLRIELFRSNFESSIGRIYCWPLCPLMADLSHLPHMEMALLFKGTSINCYLTHHAVKVLKFF